MRTALICFLALLPSVAFSYELRLTKEEQAYCEANGGCKVFAKNDLIRLMEKTIKEVASEIAEICPRNGRI